MRKAVIFDLDGTLLNTLDDLAGSMNYALTVHGLPTYDVEKYKYFVGNGMSMLAFRVLPDEKKEDGALHRALLNTFLAHYAEHSLDKTRPYDGIDQLILSLRRSHIKTAVVTNKAQQAADKVIGHFFPDCFDAVVGQSEKVKTKPDPSGVRSVLRRLSVKEDECLFVGDSSVDMITAINAKIESIGVLWGFRTERELIESGARNIARTPDDIFKIAVRG